MAELNAELADLYCDHCGRIVVIRGVTELEFVHTHGGVFCMTTVAEINGVRHPKTHNDGGA